MGIPIDYKYLRQPYNYVIYQGNKGLEEAEYLKNVLKYPIEILHVEEISKIEKFI